MPFRKRRKRALGIVLSVVVLALLGGGLLFLERHIYGMAVMYHMPVLAKAMWFYGQEHRRFPDSLAGLDGPQLARRLPASGWEEMWGGEYTGPAPHYAPIHGWDGNTPFVLAVRAVIPRLAEDHRVYVVAGEAAVRGATEAELAEILATDDRRREQAGQEARWADIHWRSP